MRFDKLSVLVLSLGAIGWILLDGCSPNGGNPIDTNTVSGSISAAADMTVDSDTNDDNAPFADNGSFDHAQQLEAPTTVGGHANQPGSGMPGRTYASGDRSDFFRVYLEAGQRVALTIAGDGSSDDLDLYLFDRDRNLVGYSNSVTPSEAVTAVESNDYYVEVLTYQGSSNYLLAVARTSAQSDEMAPMADFEPGEILVRFREAYAASALALEASGLKTLAGAPEREMLVGFSDPRDRSASLQAMGAGDQATDWAKVGLDPDSETARKLDTLQALKHFRARPDVHQASLNFRVEAFATPTDPLYPQQWHYDRIDLPAAWDAVAPESGITVAVIDTGVVLSHPDLRSRLVSGMDFVSDGDGLVDADPDDPSGSFHGTHVAGTIAADTSFAGGGQGGAGVAWNARIEPVRVIDENGSGTMYDVIQGVRFAGGLPNDSGVTAAPADVINMSLGCLNCYDAMFQDVISQVRANGTIVVASAGNSNSNVPNYPAAFEGVIAVSATGPTDDRAYYSSYGPDVDVAAPGGDMNYGTTGGVLSTSATGSGASRTPSYAWMQGTSMAAPHVAGVVALMLGVNPSLTPGDVDALFVSGAITRDLGAPGRDDLFGYGLIDARAAVYAAAARNPRPAPVLDATPRSLDLGSAATTATITVSNAGGGTLGGAEVAADPPWLDVVPLEVDAEGLGTYSVRVDRSGLASGPHSGTLLVSASANGSLQQLAVEVSLTVPAPSRDGGDVGLLHVILVDPDTYRTLYSVGASFSGGRYRYSFQGVDDGTYLVVAGTDYDRDRTLCVAAEACGAYPTPTSPTPVVVAGDLSGVDFPLEFVGRTSAQALSADVSPAPGPAQAPLPRRVSFRER